MESNRTVLIVGGGASGLMAALHARRQGASVTILEQNDRPGKKILATGNGRCNLTNQHMDASFFRGSDPSFVLPALNYLDSDAVVRYFSTLGLKVRELRDGWIYPHSQQASSVLDLLLLAAKKEQIRIRTNTRVLGIQKSPQPNKLSVQVEGWSYEADAVILCCGSKASAVAGSDGSGYQIAQALGHRLIPPLPALTGLKCERTFPWAGVRCPASITLFIDGVRIETETGELQLTDYGISGIPVFQLSRYAIRALSDKKRVEMSLNFLPDYSPEELAEFVYSMQKQFPERSHSEILLGLLPEKLSRLLGEEKKTKTLLHSIQNFRVMIKGSLSYEHAQVCSGGIDTSEIDPTTLESKLLPGLWFAGELVDIDGPCGGYNLQWAWSSGALAGTCAALGRKEHL